MYKQQLMAMVFWTLSLAPIGNYNRKDKKEAQWSIFEIRVKTFCPSPYPFHQKITKNLWLPKNPVNWKDSSVNWKAPFVNWDTQRI